MFKRIKNTQPSFNSTAYLSNQKKKKPTTLTYSEQHRLKKNTDALEYQIVDHGGYFYQGCYVKTERGRLKDGEGILLTKRGLLIIGNWIKNSLQGRCIILTPFGGTINANFIEGKLQGWCIASYLNKIIVCTLYYNDKIDGEKLIYQDKQKLWVASKYNKEGQFQKIVHVEKSSDASILPTFVEDSSLEVLLNSFHENIGFDLLNSNRIKFMSVTKDISYIGYVDENGQPCGLGLLYGFLEHYAGNFSNGVLEIYGRILFQNGSIYHGELLNGQFHGVGCYYDPQRNCSCIVQSENNQIIQKQKQIQGYVAIEVQTKLGKKIKIFQSQRDAIRSNALIQLCSFLQQYYVCYTNQLLENKLREMSIDSQYPSQDHVAEVQSPKRRSNEIATPKAKKLGNRWIILNEAEGQSQYQLDKSEDFGLQNPIKNSPPLPAQSSQTLEIPQKLHKVYSLQKKDIGQKYNINNFQSIPIKQLSNAQQSQTFKKNIPKQHIMNSKKMPLGDKIKSLDPGQITFRTQQISQRVFQINPIKTKQLNPNQLIIDSSSNNLSSIKSSQISNLSAKMSNLVVPSKSGKTKNQRKKIFQ